MLNDPPTACHQRWQIDFKVDYRLDNGQALQLHDVYDPYSGAHIGSVLYPALPGAKRVPVGEVIATLRGCFSEWGTLPDEIQTDGEGVLVGKPGNDFPSAFTLWLVGLGIRHRVIPPGKPTYNGGVERDHRTTHDYALVGQTHLAVAPLQSELDVARGDLNACYPSRAKGCHGRPPLLAHPELRAPRRAYHPALEDRAFDLARVDAYLAGLTLQRRVGKTGQLTIGGQHERYFLHARYAGQLVQIHFDPADRTFVASLPNARGERQELKRWPARGVSREELLFAPAVPPSPLPEQLPLPIDFIARQP